MPEIVISIWIILKIFDYTLLYSEETHFYRVIFFQFYLQSGAVLATSFSQFEGIQLVLLDSFLQYVENKDIKRKNVRFA